MAKEKLRTKKRENASHVTIVHSVCFQNVPRVHNIATQQRKKQETNDRMLILSV